jgi:Alginate export
LPSLADGRRLGLALALALAAASPLIPGALAEDGAPSRESLQRLSSRAAAAAPEGDVPPFASFLEDPVGGAQPWLVLGVEQRLRYESRTDRVRERPEAVRADFGLSRSRLFLGIAPESAPVRVFFEAQDARKFASDISETVATVDHLDLLQLRAHLDLERWLGAPVRVDVGRSSFDALDRRLIARNRFRNTTNAFDGLRIGLGRRGGAVGADVLALVPVDRRTDSFDPPADDRKLVGLLGRIAGSSLAVEPYYLFYESENGPRQALHTVGAHLYGTLYRGRVDHDLDVALQGGSNGARSHRALAIHAELGRTFQRPSSPRLALWVNYATGDRDPADDRSQRFEPLFGASHAMYGFTDFFSWQNLMSPTLALSFRPTPAVRAELFYRLYWLASSRDALVRAGLVDPTGDSGRFVGQGIDAAIRYRIARLAELEIQYGELVAGSFVDRAGDGRGARVVFASLVLATGGK